MYVIVLFLISDVMHGNILIHKHQDTLVNSGWKCISV